MALKPDFRHIDWAVDKYMTATAEKGFFVVYGPHTGPSPSGAALDQGENVVSIAATPSGYTVAGCLFSNVVNKDLTQTHLDQNKDEVNINQKVSLLTQGWVVTNAIQPGITPSGGQTAYLGGSGRLTNTTTIAVPSGISDNAVLPERNPKVGKFLTAKDADGYAKVQFNL